MIKKNFYFLLMAALVCGLSLSVTSCKDDDKDNNGGTDTGLVEDGLSEEDAQASPHVRMTTKTTTVEPIQDWWKTDCLKRMRKPGRGSAC